MLQYEYLKLYFMLTKQCLVCGNNFTPQSTQVKRGKGLYCSCKCFASTRIGVPRSIEIREKISKEHLGKHPSKETRLKMSLSKKGKFTRESNPRWKGGGCISHGYILIFKPEHPLADCNGRVPEHRLIMEKSIGRFLDRKEFIHHINRNKQDNRIENLQIMDSSSHAKLHSTKYFNCIICGDKHLCGGYCKYHYYHIKNKRIKSYKRQ